MLSGSDSHGPRIVYSSSEFVSLLCNVTTVAKETIAVVIVVGSNTTARFNSSWSFVRVTFKLLFKYYEFNTIYDNNNMRIEIDFKISIVRKRFYLSSEDIVK